MKIAQVVCVWPPYGGGMGRVAFEYSKILSTEHQVTVFTPSYSPSQTVSEIAGVEIKHLKSAIKYGNAVWLPQLPGLIKDFDVIHLHYPFFGVHEFIRPRPRQKLIVNYHMRPQARGLASLISSPDSRWSEKLLVKRASTWIVSSHDFADVIVRPRLGNIKINILPFGVDVNFLPGQAKKGIKDNLGIREGEKVILFVGGLDSQHYFKGLPVLLRALSGLEKVKLIVVGEGNLRPKYELQVSQSELNNKVIFAGAVTRSNLPDYYRLADIFVLSSINSAEAFGLVILEAAACGVPAVVTDLPGPRSLVKDGQTGLVARIGDASSLADKISALLKDDSLREKMGRSAHELVEQNYRWSTIGSQLLKLYQEL
ncbi:TPA: hypothetical protein DIC39_03805 [Patescibacteria group bacterium]|nr:MAG: Glycosyltransferase (Modular protein) [Parcubacteria group bacterium GW2011_GWA2_46_39]HBV33708.1 hypothetical protein [Patescibacteria group bacterium]HCU48148.1 hypothetical protein [Patescibacteria group bacterium]